MVPFLPPSTSMGHLPPLPLPLFPSRLFFSRPTCEACGETDERSINAAMPRVPSLRSRRSSGEKIPFSFSPPSSPPILCSTCCIFPFFWPPFPLFSPNLITNGVTALNNPATPKKERKDIKARLPYPPPPFSHFSKVVPPLHIPPGNNAAGPPAPPPAMVTQSPSRSSAPFCPPCPPNAAMAVVLPEPFQPSPSPAPSSVSLSTRDGRRDGRGRGPLRLFPPLLPWGVFATLIQALHSLARTFLPSYLQLPSTDYSIPSPRCAPIPGLGEPPSLLLAPTVRMAQAEAA